MSEPRKQTVILPFFCSSVAAGTSITKNFTASNKLDDLDIVGLIVRYKPGVESAKIKIKSDKNMGRFDLVSEGAEVSSIGTPKTSTYLQILKLKPMKWPKSSNIDVSIGTPAGVTLADEDIAVSFVCEGIA